MNNFEKEKKCYTKLEGDWIRDNGIKVGSKVIVQRKADGYEDGWDDEWVRGMDKYIGMEAEVVGFPMAGIGICLDDGSGDSWFFPYFVLSVVDDCSSFGTKR